MIDCGRQLEPGVVIGPYRTIGFATLDRVRRIVSHYLPADHIWHSGNADQTLDQLGIDSLDRVEIAIAITEAFDLGDALDQRPDLDTAAKIARWIDEPRPGYSEVVQKITPGRTPFLEAALGRELPETVTVQMVYPSAWWERAHAATMPELRGEEPTLDLATDYVCVPVDLFERITAMFREEPHDGIDWFSEAERADVQAFLACRPLPDMERF